MGIDVEVADFLSPFAEIGQCFISFANEECFAVISAGVILERSVEPAGRAAESDGFLAPVLHV